MNASHLLLSVTAIGLAGCTPSEGAMHGPSNSMNGTSMHALRDGDSEATRSYKMSMTSMMENMPAFSGNADRDFMMQMRGHHQAAITMAEVELAHGNDVTAKALAQRIITDQRAEIEEIDTWLFVQPE